jgi:hypothetical protein
MGQYAHGAYGTPYAYVLIKICDGYAPYPDYFQFEEHEHEH